MSWEEPESSWIGRTEEKSVLFIEGQPMALQANRNEFIPKNGVRPYLFGFSCWLAGGGGFLQDRDVCLSPRAGVLVVVCGVVVVGAVSEALNL